MSTPEQVAAMCRQARESERDRCVEIIRSEMAGQVPLVQALLLRLINLILADD